MVDPDRNGNWVEIDGRKEWVPDSAAWPAFLAVFICALIAIVAAAICAL